MLAAIRDVFLQQALGKEGILILFFYCSQESQCKNLLETYAQF